MKTKTLLMTAAMLLCFSAVASAQAIYTVSSIPVTAVISSGNAELAGNVTFTQSASTTSTSGTITIQYGGTNVGITTPWSAIVISGTGGYCSGASPCTTSTVTINTTASTYSPASLVLTIPNTVTNGTFTVSNVRVAVNSTGLTSLTAYISTTGNQIAAGSASVSVINSIAAGIASVTSYSDAAPVVISKGSTSGLPSINAGSGVITGTNTTITVKEGFLAAYTAGVGVQVTLSAAPPKGVTFAFPATASSYDSTGTNGVVSNWICGGSTTTTGSGTAVTISSTTTNLSVYYYVATDNGDTTLEYLEIPVTVASTPSSETIPLASANFTYNVSLAPQVGAYSSTNPYTPYTAPAPRFAYSLAGTQTLATIGVVSQKTALLIPYASTQLGFDTALTISNTTTDPGATALGVANAAAPQSGTLTFYFYPATTSSTVSTYTTAAGAPGSGLDSSGNLVSGATYVVFLSKILPVATPALTASSFSGYVIIVTNFTNAHGVFVVSNFANLSLQSGMMGVLSDRSVLPERGIF